MASVRAVDGTYISYPFLDDGDTSTKVYNMVCTQRAVDYQANQVALDDPMTNATTAGVLELPFTGDSSAYFIGDTNHTSSPGGMLQFNRTFANIPQSVTVASGSEFVSFPGLVGQGSFGDVLNISSVTNTIGLKGIRITTSTGHFLSAGDTVYFSMSYDTNSDSTKTNISGQFTVTSIFGSAAFNIDIGRIWGPLEQIQNTSNKILAKNDIERNQASYNVITQTRYDYVLPGVTLDTDSVDDVQVSPAFMAVDAAGEPRETLNNALTGYLLDGALAVGDKVVTVDTGTGAIRAGDIVTISNYDYVVASGLSGGVFGIADPGAEEIVADNAAVTVKATSPDVSDYTSYIQNGHRVIVEASLSEWAGNILVIKTKTCKAR